MYQLFCLLIFVCFRVRSRYMVFVTKLVQKPVLQQKGQCYKAMSFPCQVCYFHLMLSTIVLNIV